MFLFTFPIPKICGRVKMKNELSKPPQNLSEENKLLIQEKIKKLKTIARSN